MALDEIIEKILLIHSKRAYIDVCMECARDYPCLTRQLLTEEQNG